MIQRCSYCGGRFGMIRHRHFSKQFCKAVCKEQYLQALIDSRHAALRELELGRVNGFLLTETDRR
jgi:hypothetical protein